MMNDCPDGDMRDLLPGYVHGTLPAGQRAAVAAHLTDCADCATEVELITAAARAFATPDIDLARIVSALPAAPRHASRAAARPRPAIGLWRVAAAVGVVALGAFSVVALRGVFGRAAHPTVASNTAGAPEGKAGPIFVAAAPPPGSSLPAAGNAASHGTASATVAPALAASRPAMSFGGGLSDLTDDQLDTLLSELDGIEALPTAEPETHLTPILPPGDGGHGAR